MLRYFQNLLSPAESVISYFWQNSLVNMVFIYIRSYGSRKSELEAFFESIYYN